MIKRILIAMLLIVATVSCKPEQASSNHPVCIPTSGGAQTDASGKKQEPLEDIEKHLKDEKIITTLVTDIKEKLLGNSGFSGANSSAAQLYMGIATSPSFQYAMGAAFSLFVTIYGLSIAAGLVQVTIGDAAIRIIKVSFISIFAVSWGEFYGTVASFFINGIEELMAYFMLEFKELYFTQQGGGGALSGFTFTGGTVAFIFNDLDIFVSRIFSPQTLALGSALMSSGQGNIPLAGFLVIALMFIFMAIITVVQVYVMSLFALALLFALAPIFLVFMLFTHTKQLFDNWLNQIISYSLQPIFVCAFVGMFIGLLAPFLNELLEYKICYGGTGTSGTPEQWCFVPKDGSSTDCVPSTPSSPHPIPLQKLVLFFVFAWLFGANVRFSVDVASSISPSFAADMSKHGAIWKQIQEGRGGNQASNAFQFFR